MVGREAITDDTSSMKFLSFPAQCGSRQVLMSSCVFAHKLKKTKKSLTPPPPVQSLYLFTFYAHPPVLSPPQVPPSSDFLYVCAFLRVTSPQPNHEKRQLLLSITSLTKRTCMYVCIFMCIPCCFSLCLELSSLNVCAYFSSLLCFAIHSTSWR